MRSFMAQRRELKEAQSLKFGKGPGPFCFGALQCPRPRPRGSLEADPATLLLGDWKKDRLQVPPFVSCEVACRAPGRAGLRDASRKCSRKPHWKAGVALAYLHAMMVAGLFAHRSNTAVLNSSLFFRGCPQGHQAQTPAAHVEHACVEL